MNLLLVALAIPFFYGIMLVSFAVLVAPAWAVLPAATSGWRWLRPRLGLPPSAGTPPHGGQVALLGWALSAASARAIWHLEVGGYFKGTPDMAGPWGTVSGMGLVLGMGLTALGVAVHLRRDPATSRRGERLCVWLAMLAWGPIYVVLFSMH